MGDLTNLQGLGPPSAMVTAAQMKPFYRGLTQTVLGVNLNAAATDVGSFTGLPAKYRVIRLTAFDASTSLTLATIDLRTATGGGGTAVVAAFAPSALVAATNLVDCTLAAPTSYQTASTLTIRNVTPQGGAATATFLLEIQDLT